ncbi:hypothetical protein KQH70_09965 [Streptococcus sanguinis]|uniref:hypothetical protein n=1 Tax=Streptococcus sanguinis TaxID=1305 RepID=UPI000F664C3D|nr:hypothetical protein [Streptococcus sanguinis]RSI32426.1 hypothetical protein D8877_02180 [Streptococcus sanguinis]
MTEKIKKFVGNLWAFIKKHGLISALVLIIGILILANIYSGDKHPQNQNHLVGESTTMNPGEKGYFLKSKIENLSFIYQGNLLYGFVLKGEDYWVTDDDVIEVEISLKNYVSQESFQKDDSDKFKLTIHRMDEELDGETGKHKTIQVDVFEDFAEEDENLLPVGIDRRIYTETSSANGYVSHHLLIHAINRKTGEESDWLYGVDIPGLLTDVSDGKSSYKSYSLATTSDLLPMFSNSIESPYKFSSNHIVGLLNYEAGTSEYNSKTKKTEYISALARALKEQPDRLDNLRLTQQFPKATENLKKGGKFYWINTNLSGMTYLTRLLAPIEQDNILEGWQVPANQTRDLQSHTVGSYSDYVNLAYDEGNFSIGVKNELAPFIGQNRADETAFYWQIKKGNLSIVDSPYKVGELYYSRWVKYLWASNTLGKAIYADDEEYTEKEINNLEATFAARQKGELAAESPVVVAIHSYGYKSSGLKVDYTSNQLERIKKLTAEGPNQNIYFVFVTAANSSNLSQSQAILDLAKEQPQKLIATKFDDQIIANNI